MDVISGYNSYAVWNDNTNGSGDFGPEQTITALVSGVNAVHAADIDGDGDMDVLTASGGGSDSKIAWYENQHPLSIEEHTTINLSLYPNPTGDLAQIMNSDQIQISGIAVYDALGRMVLTKVDDFSSINISSLSEGILFVQLKTEKGLITLKLLKN
jgi:hypothetical protein